jgi:hypothetical protein
MISSNRPIKLYYFMSLLSLILFVSSIKVQAQWTTLGTNIYNTNTGYVGIGDTTPTSRLTIYSPGWAYSLELYNGTGYRYRINGSPTGLLFESVGTTPSVLYSFRNSLDNQLFGIYSDGHVNIGAPTSGGTYTLNVGGNIRANGVVVNTSGADYVFDKNYNLKSLDDLELYIKTEKHLPEIPSADEMQKKGANIGDIQTKLLAKVEELTLYIIELKKENETLQTRVSQLENK